MKNNKKSGFTLIEAVIILVIIALLALLGYVFYNRFIANKDNQTKTTNSSTSQTATVTPSSVIANIQSKLADTYTVSPSPTTGSKVPSKSGVVYADTNINTATAWQVSGDKFFTSFSDNGAKGLSLAMYADSTGTAPDQAGVIADVTNVYESNNLKRYQTTYNGYDYYTSDQLICSVSQISTMTGSVYAGCATPDAYKTASEALQPFYAALVAGDSSVAANTTQLTLGKIKNSPVSGYQNAWVSYGVVSENDNYVGGAAALFYKVGNGDWKYFRSSQSVLACSEYNTQDLRNAFKGESCYDTSNADATVN